ncbi:MAG TPA: transcriptional regulator [Candidatus Hydrogenedens sp.]|nr:transcriptional regulator [Candidatus Hydrogenedens sp.]HOK08109.1 transcriptional regulator [Candidatus Hydrogenedens sp.]HOL20475.1 transcriptional regulator [Candidatus Hydrogenedens sp.]HPP57897.1 transcriptional regulator [Candidatus Hydrogenedens sp.]
MSELDRIIHEPARLRILTILAGVEASDFNFLLNTLGLTKGNLSSHMDKLEKAGYVKVEKSFNGRIPHTEFQITEKGRDALENYWKELDRIRNLNPPVENE